MIFCSTKLIVFLLLMASLEKTSSNNKIILESELPKKVQVKRSYADLLNSLIKVNQERVTALKKLYVLNSITYGKDVLRSTIENKLDDYDKMQERLIRTLRQTLDNLKLAPKVSIDENELDEILQDRDHIFVLPIENNIDKEQNYKTKGKKDNKLRKKYASHDHVLKWRPPHPRIILIRPKLMKSPNDVSKLHSISESLSSDKNRDALREKVESSDSEQYNSTEIEKIIFLPNNTHKYIKTAEVIDSTNEDINDGTTGQRLKEEEDLKCINACKEVIGNVCDAHTTKCGAKERHLFEKDCFKACN
ncbi:uncharacterized protein LOC123878246 isoform X2 [Maniola jurtina]|uniref:uncharacterized protein LOC123878246 isoform X2 n=1 Tax=Maniola jurtina TaxID=191418 RepID=UPI001E68600B|nr:uncharacterized protein LOC123878246 isoform X2 [Maniola jurtina]